VSLGIDWARAIPRFLADRDSITLHKAHRWVTFAELKIGMSISGGGHIYLGVAVTVWASSVLTMHCPSCDGRAYVITAGGSDLSGHGHWLGWCPQCGMVAKEESVTNMVRDPVLQGNWGMLSCQPVPGIVVPGWMEFMDTDYPDCLVDDSRDEGDL